MVNWIFNSENSLPMKFKKKKLTLCLKGIETSKHWDTHECNRNIFKCLCKNVLFKPILRFTSNCEAFILLTTLDALVLLRCKIVDRNAWTILTSQLAGNSCQEVNAFVLTEGININW